jgi:hypothetical protein
VLFELFGHILLNHLKSTKPVLIEVAIEGAGHELDRIIDCFADLAVDVVGAGENKVWSNQRSHPKDLLLFASHF